MAGAAFLCGSHARAADPPNFDFNGYAQVATAVGQPLNVYSVLTNNGVVPTPIFLDFANFQHTLVIQGTLTSAAGLVQHHAGASIAIYSDAKVGGTAADYSNLATFTDGALVLSGTYDDLIRNAFTPSLGSFAGNVTFTGGTRLAELSPPDGWPCGGGWSRTLSGIPAGFQENWDGKIDLAQVAVLPQTWGRVKQLFE
jgi:hypothetical protein